MAFLKVVCGVFFGLLATVVALKLLGIAFFLVGILWGLLKFAIVVGVIGIVFYAVYKLVTNHNNNKSTA